MYIRRCLHVDTSGVHVHKSSTQWEITSWGVVMAPSVSAAMMLFVMCSTMPCWLTTPEFEQRCASDRQLCPGDVFHPSFHNGKLTRLLRRHSAQHSTASALVAGSWTSRICRRGWRGCKRPAACHGSRRERWWVLPHRCRVIRCVGSVLSDHITRDRIASHHLHRPAKTLGQSHAAAVCCPLAI